MQHSILQYQSTTPKANAGQQKAALFSKAACSLVHPNLAPENILYSKALKITFVKTKTNQKTAQKNVANSVKVVEFRH